MDREEWEPLSTQEYAYNPYAAGRLTSRSPVGAYGQKRHQKATMEGKGAENMKTAPAKGYANRT